jgi:hypothetical protein
MEVGFEGVQGTAMSGAAPDFGADVANDCLDLVLVQLRVGKRDLSCHLTLAKNPAGLR